jgi:hypothetical protein
MSVIQIRKAQRANARLFIVLTGWTGKGKTYTAIQLGYGLANYKAEKVGLLDAENRRGSLNDDILENATRPTKERFLIGDLVAPFSPRRYIDAITEFEQVGVEVLIIDSVTHEWESTGGCQDIAEAGNPKVPNWNLAKKEHKRFMDKMLQCDMHIIACVRAREKTKPERDPKTNKLEFVELGLQPIQEKNFPFEATASLMMYDEGKRQEILKCPAALLSILGRKTDYITADDGKRIRDWVDGAIHLDPVVEKYRNRLLSNTEGGVDHIAECWTKTPQDVREALGEAFHGTLTASAKAYDDLKQISQDDEAGDSDALTNTRQGQVIAQKAMAAAAEQPKPSGTQLLPGADKGRDASLPTEIIPNQSKAEPKKADALAAKAAPAPAKAAPREPKQRDLAPPITGVLDSDPVF